MVTLTFTLLKAESNKGRTKRSSVTLSWALFAVTRCTQRPTPPHPHPLTPEPGQPNPCGKKRFFFLVVGIHKFEVPSYAEVLHVSFSLVIQFCQTTSLILMSMLWVCVSEVLMELLQHLLLLWPMPLPVCPMSRSKPQSLLSSSE